MNDLKIATQVKSKLAPDIGIPSVTNFSVDSTNGVATLAGQVDSGDTRTKVEEVEKKCSPRGSLCG